MANAKITDVAQMLASNMALTVDAGKGKATGETDFSTVLDGVSSSRGNSDVRDAASMTKGIAKTEMSSSGKKEIQADESMKKQSVDNPQTKEEVVEDASKAAGKIIDKIEETLDVSEEDVINAMETLGLSMVDLFDPAKLTDLMMELSGVADSISLITDADAYMNIKSVIEYATAEVDSLLKDNAITLHDFEKVMNDADTAEKIAELVLPSVQSDNKQLAAVDNNQEDSTQAVSDLTEPLETTAPVVDVEITRNDNPVDVKNQELTDEQAKDGQEAETGTKAEVDPSRGRNQGFEHASKFTSRTEETKETVAGAENYTQVVRTEVNNVGDVVETITRYANADANEIMSQITESIKVNYSQDTTTMEMLLHPASLGTVNMQLTSEGGIVSAHIIVQNEAVKAAIESQLIALQQSFEEQGQKVESVEVSVANYDLNKGTEQNSGNNDREQSSQDNFKLGNRRRINLSNAETEEEDIEEEISEEEKITRDMMEKNGNTVDYTV